MANAPDTLVLTGPNFEQDSIDALLITPTGGSQGKLADFINGGTVAQVVNATFVRGSVSNNLSAAGSNIATGLALTSAINVLGTVTTGQGVILPPITTVGVGGRVELFNNGAGTVTVYGAAANTIDTIAGTTGVKLSNALRCEYVATTGSTYVSAQLGVVSA